jgi:hypothetical protein
LSEYAQNAKQPLVAFTRESILDPGKYLEKGFANIMPKTYESLPPDDLQALVDFLTKPQG